MLIIVAWLAVILILVVTAQAFRLFFVPAGQYLPWRRAWLGLIVAALALSILFLRNALALSGIHPTNHPFMALLLTFPVRIALTNLAALGLLACATECHRIFRYRSIIERTPMAQVVMTWQGEIAEWNDAATTLLGWTAEEAIGQELAGLIIPEDLREAHRHGMAHFRETSEAPVLDMSYPTMALHKDGRQLPVTIQVSGHLTSTGMRFLGWITPRVP